MLTGEDNRTLGLQQFGILRATWRNASRVGVPERTDPFGIGNQSPTHGDAFAQKLGPAGVQCFDRIARDPQPLGIAERGKFLRIVAVGPARDISADENASWRTEF